MAAEAKGGRETTRAPHFPTAAATLGVTATAMPPNPQVFLDVASGKQPLGRIVILLRKDVCPKTVENFRQLCVGGITSKTTGKPMGYKGSNFHRIIEGFMAQGGDFTKGDGTGGESIFGGKFADENFSLSHSGRGVLSMANSGKNTNGSQFFITFKATPHLDGKHVVFGQVVEGMEVVGMMGQVMTGARDAPRVPLTIVDCGELQAKKEKKDKKEKESKKERKERRKEEKKAKKRAKKEEKKRKEDDGGKEKKRKKDSSSSSSSSSS